MAIVQRVLGGALAAGGPPPLFLDVGAHVGFFSLYAAALGAEVVSFEPLARNRKRLEARGLFALLFWRRWESLSVCACACVRVCVWEGGGGGGFWGEEERAQP